MVEITRFQQMNGCSACKHAVEADPDGKPASAYGKAFWCSSLAKPVDSKDGSACPSWEC